MGMSRPMRRASCSATLRTSVDLELANLQQLGRRHDQRVPALEGPRCARRRHPRREAEERVAPAGDQGRRVRREARQRRHQGHLGETARSDDADHRLAEDG